MKIEMYLKHIFQEYPSTESIPIGIRTWELKYERNCGCRGNVCMLPIDIERVHIQRVFLRSERFGGLLYDPTSATIYKLDKEAYEIVKLLQKEPNIASARNDKTAQTAIAKTHGIDEAALDRFIEQLREFDLW